MPLYRILRNAESKKAKAEVVLDYALCYHSGRITPKTYLVEVTPPFGKDDDNFMNNWYNIISTAETEFNNLLCERALAAVTSYDVTIREARTTLARCLTNDVQIKEASRAIASVKEKVARKEKLSREQKLVKDKLANRERSNKRLGIPNPKAAAMLPSDKTFFGQRGQPNQGRPQRQKMPGNQRPNTPKEPRPAQAGSRRPQQTRDEQVPRPRVQPNQPQARNNANPSEAVTIQYLMRELKKLMKR
jgi:hypothetical protein